jgi:hypothetical protein
MKNWHKEDYTSKINNIRLTRAIAVPLAAYIVKLYPLSKRKRARYDG